MKSPLIHLVPSKLATTGADLAAQLPDHRHRVVCLLLTSRIILEPAPELLVQSRVLGPGPFPRSFDQTLVRTQSNVLHRPDSSTASIYTSVVYTILVFRCRSSSVQRVRRIPFAGVPKCAENRIPKRDSSTNAFSVYSWSNRVVRRFFFPKHQHKSS